MAAMPKKTDPRVVVRLNPEDHERIKQLAEQSGLKLAAYMRQAALGVERRRKDAAKAVQAGAEVTVEGGSVSVTDKATGQAAKVTSGSSFGLEWASTPKPRCPMPRCGHSRPCPDHPEFK